MYKTTTLILIFLCFCLFAQAQTTYEVISILGTVINKTKKDTLKEASIYKATDRLHFIDEEAFMGVADQDGNTFMVMIHPEEDTIQYESIPLARGGRPGKITSSIDLILHFAEDTRYLIIGNETQIEFSPSAYPMNADTFFYAKYNYPGIQDPINKQLPSDSVFLTFSKEEIFKANFSKSEIIGPGVDGDTVLIFDPKLAFQFEFRRYTRNGGGAHITFFDPQQPDEKQNRLFIPFKPVFLDNPGLINEVAILYQSLQASRTDQGLKSHLQTIKEYIENKYQGQVYLPNLEAWMKKEMILE